MTLELRPSWCLDDDLVSTVLEFGAWMDQKKAAFERDGDDWQPGEQITLIRTVTPLIKQSEIRRRFGLAAGQVVGVAARWSCRSTSSAGVHATGPTSIKLLGETTLTLEIPVEIAQSIEIETCLIVNWTTHNDQAGLASEGSILWSDGWTQSAKERMVLLEGDEARIPVRSVSFKQQFGKVSSALWAIDLDTSIAFDDLLANSVTVLLNTDVTSRDFCGANNELDVAKIPDSLLSGVKVDLMRSLVSILQEDLNDANWTNLQDLKEYEDGSVAQWLGIHMIRMFGSTASGVNTFRVDESSFNRELWDLFAPNSWRSSK